MIMQSGSPYARLAERPYLSECKEKNIVLFCTYHIYTIDHMKDPKLCNALSQNTPEIWGHLGNAENTYPRLLFPFSSRLLISLNN